MHTQYSDGKGTVRETLDFMRKKGFDVVSITDHDSIGGLSEEENYCKETGLGFIYGTEFTTYPDKGVIDGIDETYAMHILGYGFDPEVMRKLIGNDEERRQQMLCELVERLQLDGYNISKSSACNRKGIIRGRANIGAALVKHGYALTVSDAFNDIINAKYREYTKIYDDAETTIKRIKAAGGIAIWAHPYLLKRGGNARLTVEQVETMLLRLMPYGLDGMETFYMKFSEEAVGNLARLAEKYNLLTTVGSDYHGWFAEEEEYMSNGALMESYTARCSKFFEAVSERSNSSK